MYKLLLSLFVLALFGVAFARISITLEDTEPRMEVIPTEEEAAVLFNKFKVDFNKTYETAEEDALRFELFKDHLKMIVEKNLNTKTATFGIFKFAAHTKEELKMLFPSKEVTAEDQAKIEAFKNETFNFKVDDLYTVDWRTQNRVTPVKTQLCGDCWGVMTTEVVETGWAEASGQLNILSPQQVLDCTPNPNNCGSGSPNAALDDITKNRGGVLEFLAYYPYTGVKGTCQFDSSKVGAYTHKYNYVEYSENAIYQRVYNGPIGVGVDPDDIMGYKGGILDASNCRATRIGHFVQIVGLLYANNIPVWVCKNQWGTGFGYGGYFYVAVGQQACNIGDDGYWATYN